MVEKQVLLLIFNFQIPMKTQLTNYDLEERTARFAESVIDLVRKEIKETKHWLRLLSRSNDEKKEELRLLWSEAQELLWIFSKIIYSIIY